jgi:NAD(P)H-flavin reductase
VLKFFVRARGGATKRLLDHVGKDKELKVFVDGPYSSPPVLIGYDSVLLIAGGSGVSFTWPLFLDLIR